MDNKKLDQINLNLTGFFKDIVEFINRIWTMLKTFFKVLPNEDPEKPLYSGTNATTSTNA
jgi:hypothetical protein